MYTPPAEAYTGFLGMPEPLKYPEFDQMRKAEGGGLKGVLAQPSEQSEAADQREDRAEGEES
jgi:hypothetical protein